MAASLPFGLYEDIVGTIQRLTPQWRYTFSECNAKSFVGHCRSKGGDIHIRVSSEYKDVRYFLTLTHECAHALSWYKYGPKVKPHGTEWKDEYRSFVLGFLGKGYFSHEIEWGLIIQMINPPFNNKIHPELLKRMNPGMFLLKDLRKGSSFEYTYDDQTIRYKKIDQRYSDVIAECLVSGKMFAIHKNLIVRKI